MESTYKRILCIIVLLLAVYVSFAEDAEQNPSSDEPVTFSNDGKCLYLFNNFPTSDDFVFCSTILVANSRTTEHGIVSNRLAVQTYYVLSCPCGNVSVGIQQTENSNSLTCSGTYWFLRYYHRLPELRMKYRLGTMFNYNLQYMMNVSCQNNLYVGLTSDVKVGKRIVFSASSLYGAKFSTIFSLREVVPFIFNNDFGFRLTCNVSITPWLDASFSISSYEDFYYPLFCAPTFMFGISYMPKNRFQITGEVAARYTDMFTLSSYLDCYWFRIVMGYTFK